jgi:hypothetical protein
MLSSFLFGLEYPSFLLNMNYSFPVFTSISSRSHSSSSIYYSASSSSPISALQPSLPTSSSAPATRCHQSPSSSSIDSVAIPSFLGFCCSNVVAIDEIIVLSDFHLMLIIECLFPQEHRSTV